jgi:hypothetical protein
MLRGDASGPVTKIQNDLCRFRSNVYANRVDKSLGHIKTSRALKPLGQHFRVFDPGQVEGPHVAPDPIIGAKIPVVLHAEQREWLDPASFGLLRSQFSVVKLQLLALSHGRSNDFEHSKITFCKAKGTERERRFEILPIESYFILEASGEFLKSRGQRFLKRCVGILFQGFSGDQESNELSLRIMNGGKVGDLPIEKKTVAR